MLESIAICVVADFAPPTILSELGTLAAKDLVARMARVPVVKVEYLAAVARRRHFHVHGFEPLMVSSARHRFSSADS